MHPNNPNTQIGRKGRASSNDQGSERDYLRAQARLAKQDFQRAAKGGAKSAKRLLSIPAWVERSPFGTLAAAFVVGYLAESRLGSRSRSTSVESAEQADEQATPGRSSHGFLSVLIGRTLRQLIESSLVAWLFPAIMGRESETGDSQTPSSEDAIGLNDSTSSSIEA